LELLDPERGLDCDWAAAGVVAAVVAASQSVYEDGTQYNHSSDKYYTSNRPVLYNERDP